MLINRHKEILTHALGVKGSSSQPYRKHFVTGPGSKDFDDCKRLAAAGYLKDHGTRGGLYGGDHLFIATPKGAKAVGHALPTND